MLLGSMVMSIGSCIAVGGCEPAEGRSTRALWAITGAEIMKMISRTRRTSTSGVTLMPEMGAASCRAEKAMVPPTDVSDGLLPWCQAMGDARRDQTRCRLALPASDRPGASWADRRRHHGRYLGGGGITDAAGRILAKAGCFCSGLVHPGARRLRRWPAPVRSTGVAGRVGSTGRVRCRHSLLWLARKRPLRCLHARKAG